jgi:hypothetical protein
VTCYVRLAGPRAGGLVWRRRASREPQLWHRARRSGGGAKLTRAAAFNGGEAAPVMDDVDGVALQCQGRREKVRGESIWTERERAVVLTNNGRQCRCSGGNQRGGGISDGGSWRGGRVGGGEGEELGSGT